MLGRILSLPLIVILMGLAASAMYVPAAHAAIVRDYATMRAFLQSGTLFLIFAALLGLATANRKIKWRGRSYLLALLAAFCGLPIMLAVPFNLSAGGTSYFSSYVQMVSDLSTTGAIVFDKQVGLPDSVHLWRSLVGWLGGLLILVAAVAILAPMNLGGYEVISTGKMGRGATASSQAAWAKDGSERLRRYSVRIFPIYSAVTLILWIILLVLGDRPLVAFSHALSVMSTSGISPIGGMQFANSGIVGELFIFLALFAAVSRQVFTFDQGWIGLAHLGKDHEIRLAGMLVLAALVFLVASNIIGGLRLDAFDGFSGVTTAAWGGLFTIASFLTTTGFESAAWVEGRFIPDIEVPGILLMGLALIGGGVATTAGGVKLLRVYALYKHGSREMDRLVYPSSVGGSGTAARRIRRRGAMVAWVFFMLFAVSVAVSVSLLGLAGLKFDTAIILTVAGLSTTGPLIEVAGQSPIELAVTNNAVKLIFAGIVVLGRLETLAIIALFNPEFWRQ